MDKGKIRSVSYKIFDNEGVPRDMFFQLNSKHNVGYEEVSNVPIRKEVSDIRLVNGRIEVYLREVNTNDVQLWKDLAYNEYTSLEYEND